MSVSKRHLELSLKVQECETKITSLEKSIEGLQKDLKDYLKEARSASFKKWEIVTITIITIVASVLGAIIQKILP